VRKVDIENEATAVAALRRFGTHQNIVAILGHNWLPNSSNCYFIDMELCDFSLLDYIDYHYRNGRSLGNLELGDTLPPTVVDKGRSVFVRMQNAWTIGSHIACGLEFMHAHNQAHRDLNPRNGTSLDSSHQYLFLSSISSQQ
jgi:serine/threonine protein kinase